MALITATDASGQEFEREFLAGMNRADGGPGMTLVANEHFNPADAAGIAPELGHTVPWDPAFLLVEAFHNNGGPRATAQSIHDYINKQRSWNGISGTYDFVTVKQRGLDEHSVVLYKWDAAVKNFAPVNKPGAL